MVSSRAARLALQSRRCACWSASRSCACSRRSRRLACCRPPRTLAFSKLEAAGAFSKAEALLPLADDLKLLSTAEALLNVPSSYLFGIASLLLVGGACVLLQLQIGPRHEAGWETGPGCWNVNGSSHREPRAAAPVSAAHMRRRSLHVEFSTLWTRLARFCGVCMLCYYLFAYISRDLNSFVLYMHFY